MSKEIVRGSLQDIANNSRSALSKAFLDCEALILVDVSGSMAEKDCGYRSRFEVASDQLICLQRDHPGKIGVIPWNTEVYFAPEGLPDSPCGGTDLLRALNFIKPADNCGLRLIIISDGMAWETEKCLQLAATFKTKLDTIYVGPKGKSGDQGREFMKELARVSGGVSVSQSVKEIGILNQTITKLLKS